MQKLLAGTVVFIIASLLFWSQVSVSLMRNIGITALTNYLVSPSADADDVRLRIAYRMFEFLMDHNAKRYNDLKQRISGIVERNSSHHYVAYRVGRRALREALRLREDSDHVQASSFYQKAITLGTEQIQLESRLWLADFLWSKANLTGYENEMAEASQLPVPTWEFVPGVSVPELVGGYVDLNDLAIQQPVHIVVVWELTHQLRSKLEARFLHGRSIHIGDFHLFTWRDRLYQLGVVRNLVPDGGFESVALPREGQIIQLPLSLYGDDILEPKRTALVYDSSSNAQNMVLEIRGEKRNLSGLSSSSVDILTNVCSGYIVTGRYRSSPESRPLIGIRWLLRGSKSWDDNISTYIVTEPSGDWRKFTALLKPPQDAQGLQYWVLNTTPYGLLQVDDLGIFLVWIPHCAII